MIDVDGRLCPCRRLLDILGRPVVATHLTGTGGGQVLPVLLSKLKKIISGHVEDQSGQSSTEIGGKSRIYFEQRWFGESINTQPSSVTKGTELTRHSAIGGGLLAGCLTAALSSVSTVVKRQESW